MPWRNGWYSSPCVPGLRAGASVIASCSGSPAFLLSPIADNLTTALLMGAVVMAVGAESPRFVAIARINIVVAASAGRLQSVRRHDNAHGLAQRHCRFPDLLQSDRFLAGQFPAPCCLHAFRDSGREARGVFRKRRNEAGRMGRHGPFSGTITTAVSFHNSLHLPPVPGMMTGLVYLQIFGFWRRKTYHRELSGYSCPGAAPETGSRFAARETLGQSTGCLICNIPEYRFFPVAINSHVDGSG